jgi:hypothetical protein
LILFLVVAFLSQLNMMAIYDTDDWQWQQILLPSAQTNSEDNPASCSMDTGAPSMRVKQPERKGRGVKIPGATK